MTGTYDAAAVERAVRDLLVAVGEDPDRDGLRGTPGRMARAYREIFAGLHEDPADVLETVFDLGHDELIIVRDIPLYSMCEHHLLPFHGEAHVGYLPGEGGHVTGLSRSPASSRASPAGRRSRSASPPRSPTPW